MKKFLSICLAVVLALSLTVPAFASSPEILINGNPYDKLLRGLLEQTEDEVTIQLTGDFALTAAVVLGASDYNGLFGGNEMVVPCHKITLDLNGYTLSGEKDMNIFEVQEGYTLTVIDSSEEKTGRIVADGKSAVWVNGGEYTYYGKQELVVNDASYEQLLRSLLDQAEDDVNLKLMSDFQLTATVVIGSSDYNGLFGGQEITVPCHNITLDLNGFTLMAEKEFPIFEVQEGYTLTVIDSSESASGVLLGRGETDVLVNGGVYNAIPEVK